jgi:hypothetical protein
LRPIDSWLSDRECFEELHRDSTYAPIYLTAMIES